MDSYRQKTKKLFFLLVTCYLLFATCCIAQEIKQPDLSGSWYPALEKKLSRMLDIFLSDVPKQKIDGDIIALIQPHAGVIYSGSVAAYGFNLLKDLEINTVLIIGFSHRRHFDGVSVYDGEAFATPLGPLNIDRRLAKELIGQDAKIKFYPQAFINENSVELQLPFLKKMLPEAGVVAIAIGDQTYETCQMLSGALYNVLKHKDKFLLIASSDMSHYLTYDKAIEQDQRTLEILIEMSADSLFRKSILSGSNILCGLSSVASVIKVSQKLGADSVKILKYANSGDTAGNKLRVVGYVSAAIYKKQPIGSAKSNAPLAWTSYGASKDRQTRQERNKDMLTPKQKKRLLQIARETLAEYLENEEIKDFKEKDSALLEEKGAFVTLHKRGQLRGCIGNIMGKGPLYLTVRDMAIESATGDPRFKPATLEELKDIEIEISVLSKPKREFNPDNIVMGKHGVIVRKGYNSGVFLPQVADDTGWSREEFLSNLCEHKAGLEPSSWKKKDTELYAFTAEVFAEGTDQRR